MARKYNQDCILAHALDVLGERWTLLIIRELFLGPQRFGDLQAAMPGIGSNLLSKRLKELDDAGIISATSETQNRYKLTPTGEALRPAVRQMMHWSIHYYMDRNVPSPARDCIFSNDLAPDSVALAIEIFAEFCPAPGVTYVAHLHIDEMAYTLFYMNEEMIVRRGADTPASVIIKSDVETMMKSFRAELQRDEALAKMAISGDKAAIDHLLSCIIHDETKMHAHAAAFASA